MLDFELQNPDGSPLSGFDFGDVPPGTTSAPQPFRVVNTGDVAHTRLLAWIVQVSVADGEMRAQIGGLAVTGVSQETATLLPGLAPGASVAGEVSWFNPAGGEGRAQDTGTLYVRAE